MLYKHDGKLYIKPVANKLVEVKVEKTKDGFDVKAVEGGETLVVDKSQFAKMSQITPEEVVKEKNKGNIMGK